ncbi:MAG: glycosyltransferase [Bacteroidetes bacterium]|nr:MAG: glycosyltransferase [Bacteroidota bacterium]
MNTHNMKVSVIVPNYNHSQYLKQRIDSILNQTFIDFELIILDDFSTDNSMEIIDDYTSRFQNITSHSNIANSGNSFTQWDSGVNRAKGEYIWIAESDDFASPSFLEKTIAILEKDENLGLVYCDSKVFNEQKKIEYFVSEKKTFFSKTKWLKDYSNNGREEITDYLYLANLINNVSSVLFRKSKYIEAGLADHSMKYCGDWFLYIRILLISDIAYIAEPLNNFRIHSNSTFHSYFSNNTYLKEVGKVYSFVNKHVLLSPEKKLFMTIYLIKIVGRRIINSLHFRFLRFR